MNAEKILGLFFIILGLYSVIAYKYNALGAVKNGNKLSKLLRIPLPINNPKHEIRKSDIKHSQYSYIFGGILLLVLGMYFFLK